MARRRRKRGLPGSPMADRVGGILHEECAELGIAPDVAAVRALAHRMVYRAGRLIDGAWRLPVAALFTVPWVRDVDDWTPNRIDDDGVFRSLAEHLLCRYPVPPWMFQMFWYSDARVVAACAKLVAHIGQGGSVRKSARLGMWFGIPLSRKAVHALMQVKAENCPFAVIRAAQIRQHGGTKDLADEVAFSSWSYPLFEDEPFRDTVLAWMARQPMLEHGAVDPLMDYIDAAREEEPTWSIRGRSAPALIRRMWAWHAETWDGPADWPEGPFPTSCLQPLSLIEADGATLSITELLSADDLVAEGRALHHCVASYSNAAMEGGCAIWSLRRQSEGEAPTRILTIEVQPMDKTVVQVRGERNRLATDEERALIDRWAALNDLTTRYT